MFEKKIIIFLNKVLKNIIFKVIQTISNEFKIKIKYNFKN